MSGGSVRMIVHDELADLTIPNVDCDAFYAAVEKRDDPHRPIGPAAADQVDGLAAPGQAAQRQVPRLGAVYLDEELERLEES